MSSRCASRFVLIPPTPSHGNSCFKSCESKIERLKPRVWAGRRMQAYVKNRGEPSSEELTLGLLAELPDDDARRALARWADADPIRP